MTKLQLESPTTVPCLLMENKETSNRHTALDTKSRNQIPDPQGALAQQNKSVLYIQAHKH